MKAWIVNTIIIYLGLCTFLHFLYPPSQHFDDSVRRCGGRTPFCMCQAQGIIDQRNFLTQPLLLL